jgi:hypothetical protein
LADFSWSNAAIWFLKTKNWFRFKPSMLIPICITYIPNNSDSNPAICSWGTMRDITILIIFVILLEKLSFERLYATWKEQRPETMNDLLNHCSFGSTESNHRIY